MASATCSRCLRRASSPIFASPRFRDSSTNRRRSGVRQTVPGCHDSRHSEQNVNMHDAHRPQWSPPSSSITGASHRGQYTKSDIASNDRSRVNFSHRSNRSAGRRRRRTSGSTGAPQPGSGHTIDPTVPSTTCIVACAVTQVSQNL